MKYYPEIHHRRSQRLKEYDYSQAGAYFVTLCTQNRKCFFGEIVQGEMLLNNTGEMVEKWYYELENKFPNTHCDEFVIMPNHFHCIITIIKPVGADLCVCPNKSKLNKITPNALDEHANESMGEHAGSPLHIIIQWFKTMTTNEYIRNIKINNWIPFNGKLWQRNYYDHVIRNDHEIKRIRKYIQNNPLKWNDDVDNPSCNINNNNKEKDFIINYDIKFGMGYELNKGEK